jgi:hypothetical protein
MLLAVECGDRGLCFLVCSHFDETEAFGAAGVSVVDDLRRDDLTMLPKQLFLLRAIDLIAQVADVQLLTHRRSP